MRSMTTKQGIHHMRADFKHPTREGRTVALDTVLVVCGYLLVVVTTAVLLS